MPILPWTAYRLAAQAEAAIAAFAPESLVGGGLDYQARKVMDRLNRARNLAENLNSANMRLHVDLAESRSELAQARADLAALKAKRSTGNGNLRRGSVKPTATVAS